VSTRMPWFRMYTDFLNDPKMIGLAFEDQRHFIGVLALKSDGAIDDVADDLMLNRIVAQRLWIDHGVILEVKRRLVTAGLIDSYWQPVAWDKRQFVSDKDSTAAERKRRERAAKAAKNDVTDESRVTSRVTSRTGHGNVTRLDTEADTDTETEKEGEIPLPMATPPAPPAKPADPVEQVDTELQVACRATWKAYADAYTVRYSIAPVRNAQVNAKVKQFVQRVGHDEAPSIAAFFVDSIEDALVLRQCHAIGLLLQGAEAYRMQWATGRKPAAMTANRQTETAHMRQEREVAQGLAPNVARVKLVPTFDFVEMEKSNVALINRN
jgi:hypothetical protein